VSWTRRILFGPRGRPDLGSSRWPVLAIGGVGLAIAFAYLGDWWFAAAAAAGAALGAVGTFRRWER
jgi:hypothetical protein